MAWAFLPTLCLEKSGRDEAKHPTTNLGVRSSNLFGRAIKINGLTGTSQLAIKQKLPTSYHKKNIAISSLWLAE